MVLIPGSTSDSAGALTTGKHQHQLCNKGVRETVSAEGKSETMLPYPTENGLKNRLTNKLPIQVKPFTSHRCDWRWWLIPLSQVLPYLAASPSPRDDFGRRFGLYPSCPGAFR